MEEKRQFERFRKAYTVNYCLKDSLQKNYDISKLADISRGGLSFFTAEPYPKGTVLILRVQFPYIAEKIEMEGEVVNVQKVSPNNVHKIGIKFLNLSSQAIAALEDTEKFNLDKQPVQEKRQHPRIEKNFMIVYFLKDQLNGIHHVSWLQDISKGGLRFFCLEAYAVGTTLVFNIQFPFLYPQITAVEGEVLECENIVDGKTYRIRVKFVNLGLEALSVLEKFEK